MDPAILFPEFKISRAISTTRSSRRRLHNNAKIRSLKAGGNGYEAVKMGPSSSEQFDAPPPSQVDPVADEVFLQQVYDDRAVKMRPFSSELLSDAPLPPFFDVTNSDRVIILHSGKVLLVNKRIRLDSII